METGKAGSGQRAAGSRARQGVLSAVSCGLSAAGFTLLELVVVVGVIGILAAAVTPAVVQQLLDARVQSTQAEARALHDAIVGDHSQSRFGFVGDIGRFPTSFAELVERGSLPTYTTATTRAVGMGWRGPYVNLGTSATDYQTDAFGRAYTGASTGQVRSAGPDGIANNADDIVFPPAAPIVAGTVTATVKQLVGAKTTVDPAGYRVDLLFADNGAEDDIRDTSAPFTFTNVPMGVHAIRVIKTTPPNSGTTVSSDTIVVRPGSTTAIELWF